MTTISVSSMADIISNELPLYMLDDAVVVGSAAAVMGIEASGGTELIRTKDVDLMLLPYLPEQKESIADFSQMLLTSGWRHRPNLNYARSNIGATPPDLLPSLRLMPGTDTEWYLEFMCSPSEDQKEWRKWHRIVLPDGHFVVPSYRFTDLAAWKPMRNVVGVKFARPEVLALIVALSHSRSASLPGDESQRLLYALRRIRDFSLLLAVTASADLDTLSEWPQHWALCLLETQSESYYKNLCRVHKTLMAFAYDKRFFSDSVEHYRERLLQNDEAFYSRMASVKGVIEKEWLPKLGHLIERIAADGTSQSDEAMEVLHAW